MIQYVITPPKVVIQRKLIDSLHAEVNYQIKLHLLALTHVILEDYGK